MNNFKRNAATVCHLVIISVLGALIYSNTLTASFQFDDKLNIVDNPLIRDIGNLWPPEGARWFGFLTFALNYMAGGLNPVGYHLVNTGIHIFTALSVYFFVLLTLRTPYFSGRKGALISDGWLAFACALLFVTHPVQTQAVTYIVQRFASLAALFFMLSLDFYILARLIVKNRDSTAPPHRLWSHRAAILLYFIAGLSALVSLKIKENAYTLPIVAVMYEAMFISGLSRLLTTFRKHWRIVVFLSGLVLAFFVFVITTHDLPGLFEKFKDTNEITRHDYLVTQFRVIVTYIRLLFFPVNQTIDHHYKVYSNVFEPAVIASLVAIALLVCSAWYLLKVSRGARSYLRLVSFGILWFFVTLSIESSIIPLIDVMFEHRLYLPSVGAIIAVTAAFVHALEKTALTRRHLRKAAACILAITVIALSYAAYARNKVWKEELTLWSDAIVKKPLNPRGYNMVGIYYLENSRIYEAIYYFRKALDVDSSYAEARSNLGTAYIQTGRIDEGLNELMITVKSNRFDNIDTGILYYNIGKGLYLKGMPDAAIENLNIALRYIPDEAEVYFLLGEVFQRKNLTEQSSTYFKKAHELDPGKY